MTKISDEWKNSKRPNLALSQYIPIVFPKINEIKKDSDIGCVRASLKSSIKNAKYLLEKIELL